MEYNGETSHLYRREHRNECSCTNLTDKKSPINGKRTAFNIRHNAISDVHRIASPGRHPIRAGEGQTSVLGSSSQMKMGIKIGYMKRSLSTPSPLRQPSQRRQPVSLRAAQPQIHSPYRPCGWSSLLEWWQSEESAKFVRCKELSDDHQLRKGCSNCSICSQHQWTQASGSPSGAQA